MLNEIEVIDLYTNQNNSTQLIAEKFSTYPNKIRRILIKNGISLKIEVKLKRML